MPSRNLNQSLTRGRICGTPKSGVLGSLIAASGDNGPGYLYRYLNLPADNDKEYSGYIPSVPVGLTFLASEDSSFSASGADGVYIVPVEVRENGVLIITTTFNIVFGSVNVTLGGLVGDAVASGLSGSVITSSAIAAAIANAVAAGSAAAVNQGTSISALPGNATADGNTVAITQAGVTTIYTLVGNAVGSGLSFQSTQSVSIAATKGQALANGVLASVSSQHTGGGLSDEDIAAIVAAVWASPLADKLLTVARFLALK